MSFPEQLKAQRGRLGLTQAELASFLGVSPRAVWQWEQGTLPHVLTQEGALARLSKSKRRTHGTTDSSSETAEGGCERRAGCAAGSAGSSQRDANSRPERFSAAPLLGFYD